MQESKVKPQHPAPEVSTLEYRNGLYQGQAIHSKPQGIGLFLDDLMRFYCSAWQDGMMHGPTVVFSGHGKYLYGDWQQGQPHGFNVFRSGDIVLLGHYQQGQLAGEFLVIFEQQNLLVVVSRSSPDTYSIRSKYEFHSEQDIRKVSQTLSFSATVPQYYFSLIKFLKMSYLEEQLPIRLAFDNASYKFGFDGGLSVNFNDDNYILKVGVMNERWDLIGLGATYTPSVSEEGNFGSKATIKYKSRRPNTELQNLLKTEHRRSIHFVNDYCEYDGVVLIQVLDELLRQNIINKIAQDPLNASVHYSEKDLNDSLEYYPKNKQEGQRLQLIREALYRSVGRVGAEMIPMSRDPAAKPDRTPGLPRQIHYTPPKQLSEEKPLELRESHKKIMQSVLAYEYEPMENRINRLKIQRQIEMKASDSKPYRVPSYKNLESTEKSKVEEPRTAAKRLQPYPQEQERLVSQHEEGLRERTRTSPPKHPQPKSQHQPFTSPFEALEEQPLVPPSHSKQASSFKQPTQHHESQTKPPQHQQLYERPQTSNTHSSNQLKHPVPQRQQRTPGKAVHRQQPILKQLDEQQYLPKFNGGDSPHHQMEISQEDHLITNPSSRRLIPVVHETRYTQISKPGPLINKMPVVHESQKTPPPAVSPPKKNYSYLEAHRKEKERVTTGRHEVQEGTIRNKSKSPIRMATASPAKHPAHSYQPVYQEVLERQPTHHEIPRLPIHTINPQHFSEQASNTYFKNQQQRNIAMGYAARKYDYIRNL